MSGNPRRHTAMSLLLLVAGILLLAQGTTKPFLWLAGERTAGHISYQENAVSSRGALWVRYKFSTPDGGSYSGTAMTSSRNATFRTMQVAYLSVFPGLNMPAYKGYALLLGVAWSVAGIALICISRLFHVDASRRGRTQTPKQA